MIEAKIQFFHAIATTCWVLFILACVVAVCLVFRLIFHQRFKRYAYARRYRASRRTALRIFFSKG